MPEATTPEQPWFAVRCLVLHHTRGAYEERITLWRAQDFDEAIALAEDEARDYACDIETAAYVGLAQAYHLTDEPGHGAEIFSLIRDSSLSPDDYVTAFFDTGTEHQQT